MPTEFDPPIDVGDPDGPAGVGPANGAFREWNVPRLARPAPAASCDVVAVALGARHAVAVVRHQGVYTWGDGAGGRLGRGVDQRGRGRPSKLSVDGWVSNERRRTSARYECGGQYTVAVAHGDGAAPRVGRRVRGMSRRAGDAVAVQGYREFSDEG